MRVRDVGAEDTIVVLNIAALASHEGTTLQCIIDACKSGRIAGSVVVVISNNGMSGALARARATGIRCVHLSGATHPHPAALDTAIREALVEAGANLVFLAGYMKRLGPGTLAAFRGRVLNTHPALLPKFAGHGMFGTRS